MNWINETHEASSKCLTACPTYVDPPCDNSCPMNHCSYCGVRFGGDADDHCSIYIFG